MTVARVTQASVRTVSQVSPNAQIQQASVRVVSANFLYAQVQQVRVRVVSENVPDSTGARPQMMCCT